MKQRGVFEKHPGSKVWWICYFDADGRKRREKAGRKSAAIQLYRKRKTEVMEGKKLPRRFRERVVKFSEIAADAQEYCKANNKGYQFDGYRIRRLVAEFGNLRAEIPIDELRAWFSEQGWKPGTYNRYRSTLSLVYRLATENKKSSSNPARLLRHKNEGKGRVRFLNQFSPLKTEIDYLNLHSDEESRLRAVIANEYPNHMPELEIALHTGMRPSEQYDLTWERVDLVRRIVTIPTSKNGEARYVPLNSVALRAFQYLFERSSGEGYVFVNIHGERLKGYKHWFEPAARTAGIRNFTWYCLRHTFASRLVMQGIDIRTVAELMGHKAIQMTMRYAHLAPAHNLAAVESIAGSPKATTDTKTDTSTAGHTVESEGRVN
jgi:integrase